MFGIKSRSAGDIFSSASLTHTQTLQKDCSWDVNKLFVFFIPAQKQLRQTREVKVIIPFLNAHLHVAALCFFPPLKPVDQGDQTQGATSTQQSSSITFCKQLMTPYLAAHTQIKDKL